MTVNCADSPKNVRRMPNNWDVGCKGLCACRQAFTSRSLQPLGAIRRSMLLVGAPGALRGYAFAWIIVGVERRGEGVRGDAVLDPMGDRGDDVMGRIVLRRRQAE